MNKKQVLAELVKNLEECSERGYVFHPKFMNEFQVLLKNATGNEKEIFTLLIKQFNGANENIKVYKKGETSYNLKKVVEDKKTDKIRLLEYITNKYEQEEKWTKIKSSDVMQELNIKSTNWNKLWKQKDFIKEMKKLRLTERKIKDESLDNNRKINFIIKY